MNENLLQYLWKHKLFNTYHLTTTRGETLQILSVGEHNTDAGPDFFNARIQCGSTILVGNIEVHLKSSDWKKHFHQYDKTYQNIILHVVYEDDEALISTEHEAFLTIELKYRIAHTMLEKYEDLQQLQPFIPCSRHWEAVDEFTKGAWLQRMLIERMEKKCEAIERLLVETTSHWEDAFYITLARNFGFKINAIPFELTARNIPLKIFTKNKTSILQIEAILLGVAGFLNDPRMKEKYYLELKQEYGYQKQKHKFKEIDVTLWKFLRLRPANFPQLRLVQFADLIFRSVHLFSKVIEVDNAVRIKQLFSCSASLFWDTHYSFEEESKYQKKQLGGDAAENIMINTVAPFLFLYGKTNMHPKMQEVALELFETLSPENNSVIRSWKDLNTEVKNAASSQALLHLKKTYCDHRLCLQCNVGLKILKHI
ncbi:MAG: DUF2851 family protein [Bacteroidetes bacterium]|nr:DUF2851 family protein [Bacteroidota bacterium]